MTSFLSCVELFFFGSPVLLLTVFFLIIFGILVVQDYVLISCLFTMFSPGEVFVSGALSKLIYG